jgi:hypothetical protein
MMAEKGRASVGDLAILHAVFMDGARKSIHMCRENAVRPSFSQGKTAREVVRLNGLNGFKGITNSLQKPCGSFMLCG